MSRLPAYDTALAQVLDALAPLPTARRVPLAASLGAVLAEPIAADRDLPPFDRATMDGYAVRTEDVQPGAKLLVAETIPAGKPPAQPLAPGTAAAIATGSPLPVGANAVIPHEQSDRGFPHVTFPGPRPEPWANVHRRASDARAGQAVLQPSLRMAPHHTGIAATVGCVRPLVSGAPPVARLLTSGDEVVPPAVSTATLEPHQIRNSNMVMLAGTLTAFGAAVDGSVHLPDDPHAIGEAVRRAADEVDVIVTTGGVSAGERDYIPGAIAAAGFREIIRGASIQPGRPICVAARSGGRQVVVVALPGNPVSVLATAHLFLWPVLRRLAGASPDLPWRDVTLAEPIQPNPKREAFRPAVLTASFAEGGPALVRVPSWAGSGDLVHTTPTHGLVRLPLQDARVEAGTPLKFLPWAWNAS